MSLTYIDPGKLQPTGITVQGDDGSELVDIPWYVNADNKFVLQPYSTPLTGIQVDSLRSELVVSATPAPWDIVFASTTAQAIYGNASDDETISAETILDLTFNEIKYKYCVRDDIEQIFGKDNVFRWADLDNNGNITDIDTRVTYWIEKTSREIDGLLRESTYLIPFWDLDLDGNIIEICAQLAGYKLYSARGATQNVEGQDLYIDHKKMAMSKIRAILTGQIRLDLRKVTSYEKRIPTVLGIELNNTFEDNDFEYYL